MSDTLILAAILIPILVVSIVFHEVAHGWAALALGDTTAKERRRLTLNPVRHADPVGTVLVPGALALFGGPIFGWAKPVPVNKWRLNNPRYGMMAVAAAGPGTNFALALIAAIGLGLLGRDLTAEPTGALEWTFLALNYMVIINLFLALFNLLPIPPFDGSHIVEGLLPRKWAAAYEKLRPIGMVLLVLLIAATWAFPQFGLIEKIILPPVEWIRMHFMNLALAIAES
ncbi:site-2 protease family protein [Croceicoccus gelatinilyticus]|uniref:site-2 protease family protein n=1 Tax=Croceicoccus gelatinilyticus TaxID=2835536 RepID=UPI001BCE1361|nr:site-2 protease family protein [Croceicoccus gelatinilyticus]MBS7670305.1 site-2 protease family protein [Croceicoccus gelatinilyticus]